jgi:hypothetical protein
MDNASICARNDAITLKYNFPGVLMDNFSRPGKGVVIETNLDFTTVVVYYAS